MAERIEIKGIRDLPPVSISLDDMRWNTTGSWSFFAPAHREKFSPCVLDCPVGEPINQYMHLAGEGDYRRAWEMIMAVNPFPAVCGRVCYHPCEGRCNRKDLDEPVNIHGIERFLGDLAIEERWSLEAPDLARTAQPVAVIGSGPAGLACAYHLRMHGHPVEVFEKESAPGGMLRVGVPEFRMPRSLLDAEIGRLAAMGVEFRCGEVLTDLESLGGRFPAVFLATGAHGAPDPGVDGAGLQNVFTGLDFLKQYNAGTRLEVGPEVAVIGGGNTAIDAARCSLRQGARVKVLYRRTRAEMPAHPEEVAQAEAEGVGFTFQAAPLAVLAGENGRAAGLRMIRMRQGQPDESGRACPVPVENSEFTVRASSVIFAIGELPELEYLDGGGERRGGLLVVDSTGKTSLPGVFAGGDIRPGENTVTHALADGRRAAGAIHLALCGEKEPPAQAEQARETVGFDDINTDYFPPAPRQQGAARIPDNFTGNHSELDLTLSENQAVKEAFRCFNCGTCIHCDNCLSYCPDLAVCFADGVYTVKKDYCKGCGICAQECPRYVITLEPKT